MLKKTIFSFALILSVAVIAFAADLVTGTWVGQLTGDDRVLTYNLKTEGEKLTGNVTSDLGDLPIYEGKVTGQTISFKVTLNGIVIPHEGKISNDSLKLKLTYDGTPMEGTFLRKPNMVDNAPKKSF